MLTKPSVSLISPSNHCGLYLFVGLCPSIVRITLSAAMVAWPLALRELGFGVCVSATSPHT